MRLTVDIAGDREAIAKLSTIERRLLGLGAAMQGVGEYLSSFWSGEVFASRGRVIGEAWPALSDRYAVQKAKRFPGRPPLVRTGLMQNAFSFRAGSMQVELFNTARYFRYHQQGEGVPRRVMMKVDDTRERNVVEIINRTVEKAIAA